MSFSSMSAVSGRPAAHPVRCAWFWAWVIVGAMGGLGLISLGWVALLPAAVLGWLISRRSGSPRSAFGVITGAGLPLLFVAFENRQGPGTVCHRTLGGIDCAQHLNPIPWLMIGLLLALGGLVLQSGHRS